MMVTFIGINEITAQILAWFIASSLYGISSLIYKNRKMGLIPTTVIHFFICLGITSVNLYLFYREYMISVVISFTLFYVIIYIVMWLAERHQVKKLNEKLKSKVEIKSTNGETL